MRKKAGGPAGAFPCESVLKLLDLNTEKEELNVLQILREQSPG